MEIFAETIRIFCFSNLQTGRFFDINYSKYKCVKRTIKLPNWGKTNFVFTHLKKNMQSLLPTQDNNTCFYQIAAP